MIQSFRYIPFLLIVLFFGCNSKDKQGLDQAKNDTIAKYLKLAENNSLSFKERDRWNEKAFSLIDLKKNDTVVRWFLGESSKRSNATKNASKYYKASNLLLEKSVEAKDTLNLARWYRYRAAFHKITTKLFDSSFYYYSQAEKFYKKTKNNEEFARLYYYKGVLQYNIDDYLGAEFSTNQAYSLIKNRTEDEFTYDVLLQLGNIKHNLKDFESAIKFQEDALKLCKSLNLKDNRFNYISISLNNIGNSYKELKNYDKAIFYFKEGLSKKNLNPNERSAYAFLLCNYGFCKMQLKQYKGLPNLFIKSAKIFDSLGIKNECAVANVYLSECYFRKKNIINAIKYSEKSLKLAKEAKAPYIYLIALSNAGFVNKAKASKYIQEYHNKSDSIKFEERKARNQFYKIQLQTEEITQEKETAIKEKRITISIISALLVIVILLFVIYLQRTKQKELHLIQIQQKSNEEIYQLMLNQQLKVEEARQREKKRIALELHDGIMNRLASTRLNLFVLSRKTDQKTINTCLTYIEDIHRIESEIRNVSHDLNQELFQEKDSFVTLLKQFIWEQNNLSKSNYELQIEKTINWESISSEIKMHVLRIIQEASYNCNKYANATEVVICFTQDEMNFCVSISDNGNGFDTENEKDGIGLKNIQQRIKTLNGFFPSNLLILEQLYT